jgi:transposase-like protein
MIERMAGPEEISAMALSREVGISQPTLSRWLREARSVRGMSNAEQPAKSPRTWTAQERFRVVVEAARLKPTDLGEFLRREGLHEAQLTEWTQAMLSAVERPGKRGPKSAAMDKLNKRNRELEREIHRKDKALAEVTALLVLQKKLRALWGDAADGADTRSGT